MAAGDIIFAEGSLTPSRHALKFIATGDQAALIDEFAVAREAAEDTAGTFTAWVNLPDITGNYGIVSCGDTAAIEFISLRVNAGKIEAECNAATTQQWEIISTNVVITPHRWHHIALTQDASLAAPKIYIDGVEAVTTISNATDNAAWFGQCELIDDGSIGAAEEAGAAGQIRECKGGISDVKYWPAELTPANIKQDYLGQAPASINSTLTDWWKMTDLTNAVTAANPIIKGASILFVNNYSEFTSRTAFLGAVVADDTCMSISGSKGQLMIIKAA
jgi:hypothetical protein